MELHLHLLIRLHGAQMENFTFNISLHGQEITRLLWNPKTLPRGPILSQLNPVHTIISYFLRSRFSITPPTPMSPE